MTRTFKMRSLCETKMLKCFDIVLMFFLFFVFFNIYSQISISRCLDDLLNIDNPYFEGMVNRIYSPELQLNKANTSDTEAPFLDLHLSISNGFVSSKIYDKRDDFVFDIVNFPFLDGDVPVLPLTGFIVLNLFGLLECLVM